MRSAKQNLRLRRHPRAAQGKVYAGGILATLLYGYESWCLTAELVRRLSNWQNKRIREMYRVAMCSTFVQHQSKSVRKIFFEKIECLELISSDYSAAVQISLTDK